MQRAVSELYLSRKFKRLYKTNKIQTIEINLTELGVNFVIVIYFQVGVESLWKVLKVKTALERWIEIDHLKLTFDWLSSAQSGTGKLTMRASFAFSQGAGLTRCKFAVQQPGHSSALCLLHAF